MSCGRTRHASSPADMNTNGGVYINGKGYRFDQKIWVASTYLKTEKRNEGKRPSIKALSWSCGVRWGFVKKEKIKFGRVLLPNALQKNHNIPCGPGLCSFENFNQPILLHLCLLDPSCTLPATSNCFVTLVEQMSVPTQFSVSCLVHFLLEECL